jgi:hypothetical protein
MTPARRRVRRSLGGAVALAGAMALASTLIGHQGPAARAADATATPSATPSATPTATPRQHKISQAGIGVRLDTVPRNERRIPLDHVYIVRHMNIGTSVRARITVSNTTRSTHRISLYAAAAYVRRGNFTFASGTTPNDLTTWTHLSTAKLTLKRNTQEPVTVAIHVPRTASRGQRYAVVWAAVTSSRGQITEVNRVGIRMYVDIGPGGPAAPDFVIESMTATRSAAGQPMVVARVRDTGGVALNLTGTLRLAHGPGGTSAGPLPLSDNLTLTPGATDPVRVLVGSQLPRGPWTAVLALKADLLQRTARQTITFPAKPAGGSPSWLLPAGIVLAALLLVVAGLLIRRTRRQAD